MVGMVALEDWKIDEVLDHPKDKIKER